MSGKSLGIGDTVSFQFCYTAPEQITRETKAYFVTQQGTFIHKKTHRVRSDRTVKAVRIGEKERRKQVAKIEERKRQNVELEATK